MVFGGIVTSPRGNLTLQQSLELANVYLENAFKVQDPSVALVLCHDAEVSLSQAKKSVRHTEDQTVRQGLATAYIDLGRILDSRGHRSEAQASYKKAEKLGGVVQSQGRFAQFSEPKSNVHPLEGTLAPMVDTPAIQPLPPSSLNRRKRGNVIATIPRQIFAQNVRPATIVSKLPEADERLTNTPQLACCLSLLKDSHPLDDTLEPIARNWLQAVENDSDEQERLKILATDVVRAYKRDELKDAKAVAEVVSLAPAIEKDAFRELLIQFYDGINHSGLLAFHQLDGLAQLLQGADSGYLDADDLVKILGLLSARLRDTHQQSPNHIYQLTLTASHVLDAMADTRVSGLDREKLHEPLSSYLDSLKSSSDPYLVYQAAYAYQALQCVPDDETLWQAALRRTGKVIQGVSGLVSAVKGLDLNGFIDGLKDIHQSVSEAIQGAKTVYEGASSMMEGGLGFIDGLKEGLSFKRKCAWYTALRGADMLIRDGEFATFKNLICAAPCRLDSAFQWGVCQRLGEIAANPMWDALTRRSAVAFLGEIYRKDEDWGHQANVKEWILIILMRLSSSSGSALQFAEALVHELEANTDAENVLLFQACRRKDPGSYPLKVALPALASPSLLDRVQNKPDVEGNLRQLRKQRLKERGDAVYIHPQAKASLQTPDDERFSLMERVEEFLNSGQKVFLLLGDSGAGKSTFNQQLECDLWQKYKKMTGRIPLHINLPAIDKPEQDMIAKQLRKAEFTEPEIRELKLHRKFILICDGYDESQQTQNLYTSNRLNQPGEWTAQMVISCRSEYLGVDYRDRFQPGDRNRRPEAGQLHEAVITPFTADQVQDYIKQYVSVHQPLWEVKEYQQALDLIPSLKDLVKNPFLMTLSLEVLPRMVDPGEQLSATRVTRVALYDQFIEHWLERGKKRLSEKELSPQAKAAFESLTDEGFTQNGINFLKRLAVAVYREQGGQPIVKYSRFKDEGSWKTAFFSREDEKQLLREACPLTRSGNQHRFIHRSLLEYGLTLAVFDPQDWKEKSIPASVSGRRGSTSSTFSFHIHGSTDEVADSIEQGPDLNSPLAWRYFMNEPSVLQFLSERAQQEPLFQEQLLAYIEYSKTDKKWRTAAANAITILVRAGVQFNGADFRGVQIPGADLSYGMFDSAQFQEADLRQANLRCAWMRQADLRKTEMAGVQFGELPFLMEDNDVMSCAYSPDGESFILALDNGSLNVYATSNWEKIQTMSGPNEVISSVAYSPKGNMVATGSYNKTVRLWDIESGTCIRTLTGHSEDVNSVAFSPHGDTVVSVSDDNTVRIWDVGTGDQLLALTGHTEGVLSVAYSPKGDQIASGSTDNTICLWDAETGVALHVLDGHTDSIRSVVYSPQGNMIASASHDRTLRLWDVETGTCCRIFTGHSENVHSVSYSPRADLLASCGAGRTVRIWDAETGACRQILTGHSKTVRCVTFSPKGDHVASGSADMTVRLWDVGAGAGASYQVSNDQRSGVLSVKYSPQNGQIASSGENNAIQLWDVETGARRQTLHGHNDWIRSIVYSPQGDLIASASDDETMRLWDVETGACLRTFTGHSGWVCIVAYSPRGDTIASGGSEETLMVWDVGTGDRRHALSGHTKTIESIAYSPNGNQIASGSADKTVRLWDVETGACSHVLSDHSGRVVSVVYSPKGDLIASGSWDETVLLWDVETGGCVHILIGHSESVIDVAYSPEGDQIASASDDKTTRLWDTKTGDCLQILTGHTDQVIRVKYAPKGDLIASGSVDETVRLWNVASGQCQAVIQDFFGPIKGIDWDPRPDINHLVTGCDDGSVRVWQVTEDGDRCRLHLCWGSTVGVLAFSDASIQDVNGLSQPNKQLLKQRGAVGEPAPRLREVSKKMIRMASLVSTLRQP